MNIIYGEDKYFIGAVKFFDVYKDFGFIASNNCNMPSPKYNQDFYVNSDSFIEDEAKKEGRIVVFQIEKQESGKKRAVNVRRITHSEEDVHLALSYYGEHEYIEYKDNRKYNLYTHTFKPLGLVAEKVQRIIEDDPERSPEKTAQHFKFFVEHYKKETSSLGRYIFDRQFTTEEKSIWVSLLSIFTNEESLEILKIFPSIVKYFNDDYLIRKWLESKLSEECSLAELQEIVSIYDYIPQECVDFSKSRIEQIVDTPIKDLLKELSERTDISEEDLDGISDNDFWTGMCDREKNKLLDDLQAYLHLSSRSYSVEKKQCVAAVNENLFNSKLAMYVSQPSDQWRKKEFFSYLSSLPEDEYKSHEDEIKEKISGILDSFIIEKSFNKATEIINNLSVLGEDYLQSYKQKLFPLISESLSESLRNNLNKYYILKSDFFPSYNSLTSIFDENEKSSIKQSLVQILKETQSLEVLSLVSFEICKWLSIEEALGLSQNIVSAWDYNTIKEFVRHEPELFDKDIRFAEIIIGRANDVIGNIPLNRFFDGTPIEESQNSYYSRCPERENCSFLIDLKKLISEGQDCFEWKKYMANRTPDDLLIMFDQGVIKSLPENIVESIINAISLDGFDADNKRWYSKPSLKNRTHAKVLETTNVNLFPLISKKLLTMDIDGENVPLAVLLTELMTANIPGEDDDYYSRRNWESNFSNQLQSFKRTNTINPKLAVILWAVHSKTSASSATLTDVFPELPPYLQIKIVKKLFKTISEGKITHTADSLYNLLSNGQKPICFPLEITFTYLKLREKDSSLTLNNNIMLQLLEGRDDTDEWVGIRSVVTQCFGRWTTKNLPDDRSNWRRGSYFNGIIRKVSFQGQAQKLKVFIPNKMVDEYGNLQDYNNKYYSHVIQQIQITYKENEYQVINEQNGVSYYFEEAYESELFAIARPYNFKFNGLDNYLDYDRHEDDQEVFCECRLSDKVDNYNNIAFYWCGNKPCFRPPVRYKLDNEWENYTILDFMRILNISPDYVSKSGKRTKFGHYIILSSYLKSFANFYEHLKCRECGKLMRPTDITNFASRAVTEFSCENDSCSRKGYKVYLNHCFNKQKCKEIIDSRDSKQCPNEQYICPKCGACCSTENFRLRISNLHMTGGYISDRLRLFVENDLGHWEKQEYFCYKCGKPMTNENGSYKCKDCDVSYNKQ